jgi:hypothetical protein
MLLLPVLLFSLPIFFYIVALIGHELAHAFTFVLLGGTVTQICLCGWYDLTKKHLVFHLFGFKWFLYAEGGMGVVYMYF